jgi:hypothetical protein
VQRVDERFMPAVPAQVLSDDLALMHDRQAIDVRLHRHLRKRTGVRHAVSIRLEHHRLVLVHQAGSLDAGVKSMRWQRQHMRLLRLEVLPDCQRLMRNDPMTLGQAEGQQLPIQIRQVERIDSPAA